MEYTIRRTAIERPYEALSELRLLLNKNREKQARAEEKRGEIEVVNGIYSLGGWRIRWDLNPKEPV
ncbi:hypothetical protein MUP77_04080 [Candidatus Bathyarchaeota archaeon]|nr:hypothetical protein [Candidatus Bathyarchaeota archaeon]